MSAEVLESMRSKMLAQSKVLLLNSAMMPVLSGTYRVEGLTRKGFVTAVRSAHADGLLESYIGYEQTANLISEWTDIDIPLNRSKTSVIDGQTMLVMRLKYRPNAETKGALVQASNFEFARITYTESEEEL